MDTALRALGIIGTGAALAFGFSASEPTPTAFTQTADRPAITELTPDSNCHPNYSDCLKKDAGDYDCAGGSGNGPNYTGLVQVYGGDPFGLDRDGNGWGCE